MSGPALYGPGARGATGPAGPAGPTGATGATGATGPAYTGGTRAEDDFNRTETSGWGNATSGQPWGVTGGVAGNYSVSAGDGYMDASGGPADQSRTAYLDVSAANQDITLEIVWPSAVTGGDVLLGLSGRALVAGSYDVVITLTTSGTFSATLRKNSGGITDLAVNFTSGSWIAGTPFMVRMQLSGSSVRAKVWQSPAPEPVTWQASAADNSVTQGASFYVTVYRAGANTSTSKIASFSQLRVLDP